MGIHDRDYYRESTRGWWERWSDSSATVWIILICCGVFVLQVLTADPRRGTDLLTSWGAFHLPSILSGEVWRLLTAHFLHSPQSLWHIALNMYLLYWAGREIEAIYGTREFVGFYLVTALVISMGKVILGVTGVTRPDIVSLGASGPVTALFVLFACHYPYRRLALFFVISIPAWGAAVVVVALDLLGITGVRESGIGYTAHLLGAAFAVLYYHFHLRVTAWIPNLSGRRLGRSAVAPRLFVSGSDADPTVVTAPTTPRPTVILAPTTQSPKVDEQLEAKLDQVLEKVARLGRESLSADENEILQRASEVYKQRRGT